MNLTTEQLRTIIKEELESILSEKEGKKDACYHKVKRVYSKKGNWPSAYGSGALVKCRKVGTANWGEGGKKNEELINEEEMTDEDKAELEQILKDEGGAAGLPAFKKVGSEEDVEKALDDMDSVEKHEHGDYILKEDELEEAVYAGKTVPLNKPMRGDVKKFKVYVNSGKKDAQGRIKAKKVNFGHGGSSARKKGEKTMKIRKSNPKARKNFRARHNCDNPGPKTKARYWSCKKW